MGSQGVEEPKPLDVTKSFSLAFDMLGLISVTIILCAICFMIGDGIVDSAYEKNVCKTTHPSYDGVKCEDNIADAKTFTAILNVAGISISILGFVAVQYKLFIDVISIGTYRGINGHSTNKTVNPMKNYNAVQCKNCAEYVKVPNGYKGKIRCSSCSQIFE